MNSTHSFTDLLSKASHEAGTGGAGKQTTVLWVESPQHRGLQETEENSQGLWEVQTRTIRKAKTVSASSPGSEEARTGNKEGCSEEHVLKKFVEGKPLREGGSYPSKAQTWHTEGWESEGVT